MIAIKSTKTNILLNINYINKKSKLEFEKLLYYLKNNKTKTIIMTHFPPIREGTTNPKYKFEPEFIKNYFTWNNIHFDLNISNIIGWISGHTHYSYEIDINNIKFISNQVGYKEEYLNNESKFEPLKNFEFKY